MGVAVRSYFLLPTSYFLLPTSYFLPPYLAATFSQQRRAMYLRPTDGTRMMTSTLLPQFLQRATADFASARAATLVFDLSFATENLSLG